MGSQSDAKSFEKATWMLHFWRSSTLILALSVAAIPGAGSAAGPSIPATTAWLEENLPKEFGDENGVFYITQIAHYRFAGCTLTMDVTSKVRLALSDSGSGNTIYWLTLAPAFGKQFNVVEVQTPSKENGEHQQLRTTFSFRDVRPLVKLSKHVIGDSHDDFLILNALDVNDRRVGFTTMDESMAIRVKTALTHLANLCASKSEPF
jgi:hypothetical protein